MTDDSVIIPEPGSPRRGRTLMRRDWEALRWVGEQYGARLDVLSVLLARLGDGGPPLSLRATRDVVGRWHDMRLAETRNTEDGPWVTPTRRGLDRADLPRFRVWTMPGRRLSHEHAVNLARLSHEGRAPDVPWVSERLLWSEHGRDRPADYYGRPRQDWKGWHVPDGVARYGDHDEGIEVELSRKTREEYAMDVLGKVREFGHPVTVLRYFVLSEAFGAALRADLGWAQQELMNRKYAPHRRPRVVVGLLPKVEGTSPPWQPAVTLRHHGRLRIVSLR